MMYTPKLKHTKCKPSIVTKTKDLRWHGGCGGDIFVLLSILAEGEAEGAENRLTGGPNKTWSNSDVSFVPCEVRAPETDWMLKCVMHLAMCAIMY